jgi:hypothetical protein
VDFRCLPEAKFYHGDVQVVWGAGLLENNGGVNATEELLHIRNSLAQWRLSQAEFDKEAKGSIR